ncbi:DUF3899 domain-containing protein [Acholeplasma granularum]|uniref:DUF3899 domain-containing protein n=1 Tax=Acholeplasma granularum TaxID=264635 RepID=UPI000472468B|nr:DUF3899 domain-containing protein [Acholeplasma granularum]
MLNIIKKTLVIFAIYLAVTFGFHYLFYKFNFALENLSNTFFYVGIVSFFAGLIAVTNAQNVFIGFRYFIVQRFQKKDNPDRLSYSEYKDEKINTKFTYVSVVILLVGLAYVITSVILGLIWL